jgi:Sap, sulfolipid-1-addressing protein
MFVVIRSDRPRTNGIAFLVGFLLGTALACGVGLIIGEAAVERLDEHDAVEAAVTLLLGVLLVLVGLRARHTPPRPEHESSRAGAILTGLSHVGPAAAFSMAGLLGFGGPKRFVLTLLAMASISEATYGDAGDLTLVLVYIGIATTLVWAPVGVVVIAGERAAAIVERSQAWLTTHAAELRVWLAIGIGAALIADALVRLAT